MAQVCQSDKHHSEMNHRPPFENRSSRREEALTSSCKKQFEPLSPKMEASDALSGLVCITGRVPRAMPGARELMRRWRWKAESAPPNMKFHPLWRIINSYGLTSAATESCFRLTFYSHAQST